MLEGTLTGALPGRNRVARPPQHVKQGVPKIKDPSSVVSLDLEEKQYFEYFLGVIYKKQFLRKVQSLSPEQVAQ